MSGFDWIRRLALGALTVCVGVTAAAAETKEVRIAQQFGISYLPLQVMKERGLLEKRAKATGLGDVKVTWSQLGSGAPMNDALLSGNLDFASGGVGPLLTIWAKTKGREDVKAVAAINTMPLYLTTNNPAVKSIKDFGEKDRIALPAAKVSIQARTLQMAAEQVFGAGKHDSLDKLTVSMKHPDGVVALLSGKSEITGHFTSPPYMQQELADPKIRKVLSSFDVLGGPSTFNCVWAPAKFRTENPKTYRAFVDALTEAMDIIAKDQEAAIAAFVKNDDAKIDTAMVRSILKDPENRFEMVPRNTMKYALFMHKVGALGHKPESWKDYFFPEIHGLPGS